jgi:hypothetical protein
MEPVKTALGPATAARSGSGESGRGSYGGDARLTLEGDVVIDCVL